MLIEEVLAEWRTGERLLEQVPPLSPDHEAVQLAVDRLRAVYAELTSTSEASAALIASSRSRVTAARRSLERARERIERGSG